LFCFILFSALIREALANCIVLAGFKFGYKAEPYRIGAVEAGGVAGL